ncbi:MAG: hypothetical protein EPN91_03770 [Salinibacterium sp.]|nr:MAG: hypothetical protein EPN91_03770 [Salinibacterium sp.]
MVKNSSKGAARYAQVVVQLLRLVGRRRPDAYLVTFRGYEILPIVLLLAGRRPVYYDEFINPVEWFVEEHRKFAAGSFAARLLRGAFRFLMKRTAGILTDTESHADHSAELMGIARERFTSVPVGGDEERFTPRARIPHEGLRVLYYGSMLPLHGLPTVLEAAVEAGEGNEIELVLVGGDDATRSLIEEASSRGARVDYRTWVDYELLPELISHCDLMLGGPFGDTVQARYVITGKTYQFLASSVATVVGENLESGVFTDKLDALVVPQGNASALAACFRWALEHRSELEEIGAAGHALYEKEFSAAVIARRLALAFRPEHSP